MNEWVRTERRQTKHSMYKAQLLISFSKTRGGGEAQQRYESERAASRFCSNTRAAAAVWLCGRSLWGRRQGCVMPWAVRSCRYLLLGRAMPLTINVWMGLLSNTGMSVLSRGCSRLAVLQDLSKIKQKIKDWPKEVILSPRDEN